MQCRSQDTGISVLLHMCIILCDCSPYKCIVYSNFSTGTGAVAIA